MTEQLRQADLTAAEWRLWSYLTTLDSFGDGANFDQQEAICHCGFSKSTYFTARTKLQKLGFDFTRKSGKVFNLNGARRTSKFSDSQSEQLDSQSEQLNHLSTRKACSAAFEGHQTVSKLEQTNTYSSKGKRSDFERNEIALLDTLPATQLLVKKDVASVGVHLSQNNHSNSAQQRYLKLAQLGFGRLWVGPNFNDFWPWAVKAAQQHLKKYELPAEEEDAKTFIRNRIRIEDWGALENTLKNGEQLEQDSQQQSVPEISLDWQKETNL
jgi:hypothetical protein